VLDGGYLTFQDPVLNLALDIPLWWETDTIPGAVTRFYQNDHAGARQNVLTISVLNPRNNTLESAMEAARDAWEPYVRGIRQELLGAFEAARLDFGPGRDLPLVAWLAVSPSGRAVSIVPRGDPDWIEPMIEIVLDTLRPMNIDRVNSTLPPEQPVVSKLDLTSTPLSRLTTPVTPYCRPSDAFVNLSASATTLKVDQAASVTVTLTNGNNSGVRLGLIQYTLQIQSPNSEPLETLGPVEHRLSIDPGQADQAEFTFQATSPGRLLLTGATSFEIHTLDYSYGSWSGCDSWPIEIVVKPR
jgi:hypothetical protein